MRYKDVTGSPDGIAAGVVRVADYESARYPRQPDVVVSWTVTARAASQGEGVDLLKVAEPLLRERLAELAHAGGEARFFRVEGGTLAEVLSGGAAAEAEAGERLAVPVPGTSMADFATRLTAALGPCAHPDAEPVDLLIGGETVAWVCPKCEAQLPADWR